MTYAVIDLAEGAMTFARAGHTPLMYLPGSNAGSEVQILTPSGIVVGLRIPGATEKFAELLEEDRVGLSRGDVVVLYTDGLAEARSGEQLFGEDRVANTLRRDPGVSPDVLCKVLLEAARDFATEPISDDIAILAIKRA